MRTPICDQLGIEFPIFAFTHCRDVVAAVTNAGGFGVLGATSFSPDELDTELKWIEAEVKGRPYGLDVLVPAKLIRAEPGGGRGGLVSLIPEEHHSFVDEILERYGVPPLPEGETVSLRGTYNPRKLLDVAFAHNIKLVASALGPAPQHLVEQAHDNDVMTAALVGKREHAQAQMRAGVDVIVAQGYEAGGHTGEIATLVLVPEIVDAVAPMPVLAAGGIGRGRQMAAAMALGAQGVWCGSVWLTSEEAETHPVVKEKMLAATSSDTVRSRSVTGKPARQLRSAWTDEWDGPANPDPLGMPLQGILVAEAQARIQRSAGSVPGSKQLINYFVGQIVGEMNQVKPVRRIVQEMVEEYIEVVTALGQGLEGD
jgi:NAD(P)H-dependent flavin oxidoreductase YrpB (nitropropane dioxygenase family)